MVDVRKKFPSFFDQLMQTVNANPNVVVTVRHEEVTDSLRQYAESKIQGLHLDYPKIIEAKAVLDVEGDRRHKAEIILFCANHIVIDASSETEDMYKSIDETISKIARRMRKHKTRLLKRNHSRNQESIRFLDESHYKADFLDSLPEEVTEDAEPFFVHKEQFRLRKLFKEEAIMELDLTDRPFVVFENARRGVTSIVWKKKDGDYGMVDLT